MINKCCPLWPFLYAVETFVTFSSNPNIRPAECRDPGIPFFLTVFLPPLFEVGCPIFLEIRNPWGKVMERSGLRYEHFCLKIV